MHIKSGDDNMRTAIVTDSNSGITQSMAKEMGVFVVPMPVLIDGGQFLRIFRSPRSSFTIN